ncbi:protein psiQ-like isoform X1 [Scylla paramamosain]|uniref:protein psiQ-like isoform X1 n=1 Tax=Scylla paramamosain TaxID=85552 RepID=UPI003082C9C4
MNCIRKMRSLILVILCGVATVSSSKPGDSLSTEAPNTTEEVEISYPPPRSSLNDAESENTAGTFGVILDQWPESSDTHLEYEELYHDEEVMYPLDEADDRRLGNAEKRGSGVRRSSKGYVMTTQYRKVSKTSKNADNEADKKVKRQKIKQRKTDNLNRSKPLKKNKKGEKSKLKKNKKKKRISNEKVVKKKAKLGGRNKVKKDNQVVANKVKKDNQVVAKADARKKKRCRPKGSCKKVSGRCKKKCHKKKEIESDTGKCRGKRCSCCVKKPKPCKQRGECVGKGICRKSCLANEIRAGYLPCAGRTCTCCLVDEGTCGPSVQHTECKEAGGTCKPKCDGERVVAGLCPGPHCSCCIPEIPCDNTESCKISGGKCKPVCLDTEVRLPGNCGQGRCFCCGQPPTGCTQSPTCPGTCSQTCKGVISLEVHCLGSSCLCCLDCSPKSECTDAKGVCKSLCGCGEKELPGGCNGGGCKCCVADVLECKDKQSLSCPNCIYAPLCTADHIPQETCASQKGCSCC